MRKFAFIMPLAALIAGALGCFLRYTELATAFDSGTGLATPGAPVTMLLIYVSAGVFAASFIFAVIASALYTTRTEYERAFSPSGLLYLAVFFILCLAMIAAMVMCYFELKADGGPTVGQYAFLALGALTGISFVALARGAYRGRGGSEMMLFGVMPSVFMCLWLVLIYKAHASDPVILRYCYQCLAVASAALSFYYGAGFIFGKSNPGKTVLTYLLTVFFCAVVLAEELPTSYRLVYAIILVAQLINCIEFIKNLRRKPKRVKQ